jgi:hypothetical protein
MKVWHVNLNEKEPKILSSGVWAKFVILAETLEECEQKIKKYIKDQKYDPENELYIGKIEFVEEVDII